MTNLEEFREDRINFHKAVLKQFGFTENDGSRTTEDLVNEEVDKVKDILKNGLDVGGIIKYVVKVRLEKIDGEWFFMNRRDGWRVYSNL